MPGLKDIQKGILYNVLMTKMEFVLRSYGFRANEIILFAPHTVQAGDVKTTYIHTKSYFELISHGLTVGHKWYSTVSDNNLSSESSPLHYEGGLN